jgi:hypothetical protein
VEGLSGGADVRPACLQPRVLLEIDGMAEPFHQSTSERTNVFVEVTNPCVSDARALEGVAHGFCRQASKALQARSTASTEAGVSPFGLDATGCRSSSSARPRMQNPRRRPLPASRVSWPESWTPSMPAVACRTWSLVT